MLWYGGVLTAIPKICFLQAILLCSPLSISSAINAMFFINLVAGAVILQENPCTLKVYGIGTIGFAMCLSLYTEYRKALKAGLYDEEEYDSLMRPTRKDNRSVNTEYNKKRDTYIGERRHARGLSFSEQISMYDLLRSAITI